MPDTPSPADHRIDHWVGRLVTAARRRRGLHLFVAVLRLLLGFAFLPAGLKKLLDQPFTDPANHGRFHDFLHAFHDTGVFYQAVGALQLVAAALLLTQRYALLGALVMLPVLTAITVFCWSTAVVPTAIVATLMWSGVVGLIVWDLDRWRGVLRPDGAPAPRAAAPTPAEGPPDLIDRRLWAWCGVVILGLYLATTALAGRIYRPRGVELDAPSFYLLLVIPLVPVATWWIERRRRRR